MLTLADPDRGGDEAQFKQLSASYEVLSDSRKRSRYDSGADDLDESHFGGHHHHGGGFGFDPSMFGGGGFGGGFGGGGHSAAFNMEDLFGGGSFRSARGARFG